MTHKIIEIDAITGIVTERDANEAEIAIREQDLIDFAGYKAQAEATAAAKESGKAKLAALGFTEEEIAAW